MSKETKAKTATEYIMTMKEINEEKTKLVADLQIVRDCMNHLLNESFPDSKTEMIIAEIFLNVAKKRMLKLGMLS